MRFSLAAAAALVVLPAMAQADSSASWGAPINPGDLPNSAVLEACDDASCFARVTVHNTLVLGFAPYDLALDLDGLRVGVDYDGQGGAIPDVVMVMPPPGYVAVPPSLSLQEGETGAILIVLAPLS